MGVIVKFKIPSASSGQQGGGNGQQPSVQTVIDPYISVNNTTGRVTITCYTSGATIRYTLDGTDPTVASKEYTGVFTVTGSGTIKARAYKSGYTPSDVCEYRYSIAEQNPGGGEQQPTQTVIAPYISVDNTTGLVTITCATSGATIRYTTDGSYPTEASQPYTGTFTVSGSGTIRARAFKSGYNPSDDCEIRYTITGQQPVQTVATPIITIDDSIGNVILDCITPGAKIYYTTDGTDPSTTPTASTTLFTSGFNVASLGSIVTIKAIAVKDGYNDSAIATAQYIEPVPQTPKVATPRITVETNNGYITIVSDTEGAEIHYTTDGTTPTAASPLYAPTVDDWPTVRGAGTVKAIACKEGYDDSYVAEQQYTVLPDGVPRAATPQIAINQDTAAVGIICATSGAEIYYTLDGTSPATSQMGSTQRYTGELSLASATSSVTVKAIAIADGYSPSVIATATYVVDNSKCKKPQMMYSDESHYMSLTCETPGASIYFTDDGSTPTTTSTLYFQPWVIRASCTIKAIAVKPGMTDSDIAQMQVTI